MKPIMSIKAIRCVCVLIHPVLPTKTTQALPVYLTVALCCKQIQKQIEKWSLQLCSALSPKTTAVFWGQGADVFTPLLTQIV